MDKTIEELRAEADALGLTYNQNIGAAKLAEKIEEHYTSLSAGDSIQVKEEVVQPVAKDNKKETKDELIRRLAAEAKLAAFATKVVTVSNNDKREAEHMTADFFGFENQYFGISLLVPFDIPTQLPQCIIDVIKSTPITLHKDEIVDGRRTGNRVPVQTRKYNISYEENQPQ